jgi:hypothetical protein
VYFISGYLYKLYRAASELLKRPRPGLSPRSAPGYRATHDPQDPRVVRLPGVRLRSAADSKVRKTPTEFAQKLGQLQPFIAAVFPRECVGQLASSGTT